MKKNKILGKGLVMLVLLASITGMANAVTTIEVSWSGSGNVASTVDASGNQLTTFTTGGNAISGNLKVVDNQDNPYGYGVSKVDSYLTASVTGGGLDYIIDRTNTYASYGAAGQRAYTSVLANSDATVEVATGADSNYASMGVATYGRDKTTNGKNFEGSGSGFMINHGIITSDLDGAEFVLTASGTAAIDTMSNEIGASSYKFGKGRGCFTNADVVAVGSGNFQVNAGATNGMDIDAGNVVVVGSAIYQMNIDYGAGLTYTNFALGGN